MNELDHRHKLKSPRLVNHVTNPGSSFAIIRRFSFCLPYHIMTGSVDNFLDPLTSGEVHLQFRTKPDNKFEDFIFHIPLNSNNGFGVLEQEARRKLRDKKLIQGIDNLYLRHGTYSVSHLQGLDLESCCLNDSYDWQSCKSMWQRHFDNSLGKDVKVKIHVEFSSVSPYKSGDPTTAQQYFKNIVRDKQLRSMDSQKRYLPEVDLKAIIACQLVTDIIKQDLDGQSWSPRMQEELATKVRMHAPKLFATCVYGSERMGFLRKMLEHGIDDKKMPLCEDLCPNSDDRGAFCKIVTDHWIFNPYHFGESEHAEKGSILLDQSWLMPIQHPEEQIGNGANGEVFEAIIERSQQRFRKV